MEYTSVVTKSVTCSKKIWKPDEILSLRGFLAEAYAAGISETVTKKDKVWKESIRKFKTVEKGVWREFYILIPLRDIF